MTLAETLKNRGTSPAERDRPWLLFEDERFTFADALREARRHARLFLAHRPAGRPFHVGLLMENRPEFVFAEPAEFPADAIPFDAPGVELSHQGEDCTFETLVRRARLRDRRLRRLAEVVHEADLRDGKYPHEEARGLDVAIRALLAASPDDHQVLAQGMTLCEGLYATTSRR